MILWYITHTPIPMTNKRTDEQKIYQDSLDFHSAGKKGKVEINLLKPLNSQNDLALAYSPGVSAPCLEIKKDPSKAYDYTAKGNFVAVISNGTAVLGLGNLGALASKPVMEGKAALFKRFADIDAVDLEVSTEDPDEFINAVKFLGASWGGINLEDIKAPECFIIESKLKKLMDIPVFHDDQHGTAIIAAAGIINATDITNRELKDIKVVVNGAGAAGIACLELLKYLGVKNENAILCDTQGVIYKGRTTGMNPWKEAHAVDTSKRTLADAMEGADVFLGLSVRGAVSKEMVISMAPKPIVFAMANPYPEIDREDVLEVRPDAIFASGRSDLPNQVNNVMGFPYIFRGALDVEASTINEEMKIAAAYAIAELARQSVPNEVSKVYSRKLSYGPDYIIPVPFDYRLIEVVPLAVAKAAIASGVAKKDDIDLKSYQKELHARLNPSYNMMSVLFKRLQSKPKRIIFADGNEESAVRAAISWRDFGYGTPVLLGYEETIINTANKLKCTNLDGIEITNAGLHSKTSEYVAQLYAKLQRKGYSEKDCAKLVKRDRNIFAALMLENKEVDAMITGLSRSYSGCVDDIEKVIPVENGEVVFGLSIIITNDRTLFIADTAINENPSSEDLAKVAIQASKEVSSMGHVPSVAFISFSNFGTSSDANSSVVRRAVEILGEKNVSFEYDGEMSADVALNPELMSMYPFCKLSRPANILIMPSLQTADICAKLVQQISDCTVIGPVLSGFSKSVQIAQIRSSENAIMNLAAIAATKN